MVSSNVQATVSMYLTQMGVPSSQIHRTADLRQDCNLDDRKCKALFQALHKDYQILFLHHETQRVRNLHELLELVAEKLERKPRRLPRFIM